MAPFDSYSLRPQQFQLHSLLFKKFRQISSHEKILIKRPFFWSHARNGVFLKIFLKYKTHSTFKFICFEISLNCSLKKWNKHAILSIRRTIYISGFNPVINWAINWPIPFEILICSKHWLDGYILGLSFFFFSRRFF